MTNLDEKVQIAHGFVRRCIDGHNRSVIMSSFGKDSMVLLSIVDEASPGLPVLFHREPFSPEKYAFANKVILDRGYTVYDYAPISTAVLKARGHVEIMNAYQIGPNDTLDLPTGVKPPIDGKPFLCGYSDLYCKPTGSFVFPWDLVFIGHKSSDVDPIRGPVPLLVDVVSNVGAPDYAYPLRHFTDDDVWNYTAKRGLPIHTTRYDPENGYNERDDVSTNPDYHLACTACLDPDNPVAVYCPKAKAEITNRSQRIRQISPDQQYRYVARDDAGGK